jgi:hypothetical protein
MNAKALVWVACVIEASLLTACQKTHQTVEYYKQHRDEREEMLAECRDDLGARRSDPECVNARRAGVEAALGSWRDLPPMGLVDDKPKFTKKPEREARR